MPYNLSSDLENKYQMDQRVEFGKKAAAILGCNPPQIPNTQNQFLRISEHLTIDNKNVSIDCDMLHSNSVILQYISDDLLLEILTMLASKTASSIYEAWAAKEKADYLFMLEHDLGITELPEFDWRKAYDEQWNYSRITEALELAISQPKDSLTMTTEQQELELLSKATETEDDEEIIETDYDDGEDNDSDDEDVSDEVLKILKMMDDFSFSDLLIVYQKIASLMHEKYKEQQENQE